MLKEKPLLSAFQSNRHHRGTTFKGRYLVFVKKEVSVGQYARICLQQSRVNVLAGRQLVINKIENVNIEMRPLIQRRKNPKT